MNRLILVLLVSFTACTPSTPYIDHEEEQRRLEYETSIPKCFDTNICERMWAEAQNWLASNSDLKIQVATDYLIETYNPTRPARSAGLIGAIFHRGGTAWRIRRKPIENNGYTYHLEVKDPFAESRHEKRMDFNQSLNRLNPKKSLVSIPN